MYLSLGALLLTACAPTAKPGPGASGDSAVERPDTAAPFEPELTRTDVDGDHWSPPFDCDDTDATIHPGATEVCNGRDDDCDEVTDGADAADSRTWYLDDDEDAYGVTETAVVSCHQVNGTTLWPGDCDDSDPGIHPAAAEVCDGVDQDCDGTEADASDATWWYRDGDEDGFGRAAVLDCVAPEGAVATSGDCDDTEPLVFPGSPEACNGADDNCDGEVDEATAIDAGTWYADGDGDGYGDPADSARMCGPASGWVADARDCDDTDGGAWPGAVEFCDGVDDDCDGVVDEDDALDAPAWYRDGDSDGFGAPGEWQVRCDGPEGFVPREGDCDDTNPSVNPNAVEDCAHTEDQNCDGAWGSGDTDGDGEEACTDCDDGDASTTGPTWWYLDADGDGFGDASQGDTSCAGALDEVSDDTDCDDTDPAAFPGAAERWYDGLDEACDGGSDWDADGDGFDVASGGGEDCDDLNAAVSPAAAEVCGNGVDDDCSGDRTDCALAGEMELVDADLRFRGPPPSEFGAAIAGHLELSGGGPGILVGGPDDSEAGNHAGAAFLLDLLGQESGTVTTGRAKLLGEAEQDMAGGSVAAVGDQDGDGLDDLVVGAKFESSAAPSAGAAYLVSGTATGTTSLSLSVAKLTGEGAASFAGIPVARLEDIDGDGKADFLVGSFGYQMGAGAVYILTSPVTGTMSLGSADARIVGEGELDFFGLAADGPGDLNGDGYADVAVGAPGVDLDPDFDDQAGAGYVFYGPLWGDYSAVNADVRIDGGTGGVPRVDYATGDEMGESITGAGDVNGDGYTDLAIGAAYGEDVTENAGRALLFLGPLDANLDAGDAAFEIQGEHRGQNLGAALDAAGDVDGDGFGDLLIGDYSVYDGYGAIGGACLMYGPMSGKILLSEADLVMVHEEDGDGAGADVAGAGDIDSDGFADLLLAAPGLDAGSPGAGAVYVMLGSGI